MHKFRGTPFFVVALSFASISHADVLAPPGLSSESPTCEALTDVLAPPEFHEAPVGGRFWITVPPHLRGGAPTMDPVINDEGVEVVPEAFQLPEGVLGLDVPEGAEVGDRFTSTIFDAERTPRDLELVVIAERETFGDLAFDSVRAAERRMRACSCGDDQETMILEATVKGGPALIQVMMPHGEFGPVLVNAGDANVTVKISLGRLIEGAFGATGKEEPVVQLLSIDSDDVLDQATVTFDETVPQTGAGSSRPCGCTCQDTQGDHRLSWLALGTAVAFGAILGGRRAVRRPSSAAG